MQRRVWLGPFQLERKLDEKGDLFATWDESFDALGLVLTRFDEPADGSPGSVEVMRLSRDEAHELHDFLHGALRYRARPEGH